MDNTRLRSRLIYIKPDDGTYNHIAEEADKDLRLIRDEALILIREALAARKRSRKET